MRALNPYLFVLETPLTFTPKTVDLKKYGSFVASFLIIENGTITLPAGYAWDGCSPKLSVFGLFYIGVPDGAIAENGLPITGPASAVHDALCQYRPDHQISKEDSVLIFNEMLENSGWDYREPYVTAVKYLGPRGWYS